MFNEFINKRRKELNLSVDDLVKKSGIPKSTLSKITAGISTNPTLSTVEALCKALNCSLNDAVGYENDSFSSHERILIQKYRSLDYFGKKAIDELLATEYSRCTVSTDEDEPLQPTIRIRCSTYKVSAGNGFELGIGDDWDEIDVLDTPNARKADFAIVIKGDSMEPVYFDGDIILVKTQNDIDEGQIGVFILNGEGYIKKKGKRCLISLNNKYNDIEISEYDDFRCAGIVIGRV